MPKQKDLKRLVRGRMRKTGESYTAARANIVEKPIQSLALPDGYEKLAGMGDEAVRAKTGRTWPEWASALDGIGATSLEHRAIAERLHTEFGVPDWWAQMVTVGYERMRGLRDVGQRRGGSWEAAKSKTIAATVTALYRAFYNPKKRAAWLPDQQLTVRTATKDKSLRIAWADGSAVDVYFTAKGETKSSVAIQHRKLPSRAKADEMKAFWAGALGALAEQLAPAKKS